MKILWRLNPVLTQMFRGKLQMHRHLPMCVKPDQFLRRNIPCERFACEPEVIPHHGRGSSFSAKAWDMPLVSGERAVPVPLTSMSRNDEGGPWTMPSMNVPQISRSTKSKGPTGVSAMSMRFFIGAMDAQD